MIAAGFVKTDQDSMNEDFPVPELPPENAIDVWQIDLDRPFAAAGTLDRLLSAEERNRAERFVFERDASRFRLGRAMLRLGLAWYLQRPPREISLRAAGRGKPCLGETSELYFNLTHSGGLGLLAFTTVGEVGIDIEEIRYDVDGLDIARANFTDKEAAMIAAAHHPQKQAEVFLRFWTRKEAVLKADGCGIFDGLNMLDVSEGQLNAVCIRSSEGANADSCWRVMDLDGIDGFAGAVAAPPGDWSIRRWTIACEDALSRLVMQFPGAF
jgi:4'-phosphopantetheinyl transferase